MKIGYPLMWAVTVVHLGINIGLCGVLKKFGLGLNSLLGVSLFTTWMTVSLVFAFFVAKTCAEIDARRWS